MWITNVMLFKQHILERNTDVCMNVCISLQIPVTYIKMADFLVFFTVSRKQVWKIISVLHTASHWLKYSFNSLLENVHKCYREIVIIRLLKTLYIIW